MCEKTYQHPGIEYSDHDCGHITAMRSLKWAIEKEIRELKLHKSGINLVYCAHTNDRLKEHEIEIQEQRGKYSFILDDKNLHTADSLDACVRWAKAAGHIDKGEKITGTRTAATKPVQVTVTKKPTNTPAITKTDDSYSKLFGRRTPVFGRYGWR